jgi:phosphotransacetylase
MTFTVGKAVSQHCDASNYHSAAKIQERMASNFHKKGDDFVAIEEYQRASKLYAAAKMSDDSDRTLEKAAYLLGTIGKYKESALSYQSLAIRNTHENIKKFNTSNMMLRGALLLLHDCLQSQQPNLNEVVQFVEHTHSLDCRFIESPQHDFIADVIQCVRLGELDAFADCVYSFNFFSELDELLLTALDGIKESICAKTAGKEGMVSK